MPLADDRLAQERGAHRDLIAFGQADHLFAQAEAMDFDPGDDHGLLAAVDHSRRVVDRLLQRLLVAHRLFLRSAIGMHGAAVHAVARQLQIDGPLVAVGRLETAIDFAKRRQRIVEQRRRRR